MVVDSFNKITLLDYLDKWYKVFKEERKEYLNIIPVIFSGHLVRAIKRFTENALPGSKNKTFVFLYENHGKDDHDETF